MVDYLQFSEIYGAVERAISAEGGSKEDLVKDMINMVYLNEILEADDLHPLFWLVDFDDAYKSKAPAETVTGITAAAPPVVSDATHSFIVGDLVTINGISGMTELNGRTFRVGAITAGVSYSLHDLDNTAIAGTGYTAWTSGGRAIHAGITLATSGKNVKRVLQAGWLDRADPMTEWTPEEIENTTRFFGFDDSDSATRPQNYIPLKRYLADGTEYNYLLWGPGAEAAYPLRYWIERRSPRLSADGDVPLLPFQFHPLLISGAITRLAESDVQVENQVVWPGIYRLGMDALRKFNREYYNRNPQWKREKPYMM